RGPRTRSCRTRGWRPPPPPRTPCRSRFRRPHIGPSFVSRPGRLGVALALTGRGAGGLPLEPLLGLLQVAVRLFAPAVDALGVLGDGLPERLVLVAGFVVASVGIGPGGGVVAGALIAHRTVLLGGRARGGALPPRPRRETLQVRTRRARVRSRW